MTASIYTQRSPSLQAKNCHQWCRNYKLSISNSTPKSYLPPRHSEISPSSWTFRNNFRNLCYLCWDWDWGETKIDLTAIANASRLGSWRRRSNRFSEFRQSCKTGISCWLLLETV